LLVGNKSSTTLITESANLASLRKMSNLFNGLEVFTREETSTREKTTWASGQKSFSITEYVVTQGCPNNLKTKNHINQDYKSLKI
jgi:hypothetical protein